MKTSSDSEKQKHWKACASAVRFSIFGAFVAWVSGVLFLWMLSQPPLSVNPFGALPPSMADFYGPMRTMGYLCLGLGFVLLAFAFLFGRRRRALATELNLPAS